MNDKDILKKAIQKAEKNGWESMKLLKSYLPLIPKPGLDIYKLLLHWKEQIIFNHDFAKAFFGEKDYWYETKCTCSGGWHPGLDQHSEDCARVKAKRGYKFHLKQLVIETERLKYLEKFLHNG